MIKCKRGDYMAKHVPLAFRVRANTLASVVGQSHLIGEGKILSEMVRKNISASIILYGKPGIGKNTIAQAYIADMGARRGFFNAATDKKAELEKIIQTALISDGEYYVIVDEIHRLNKNLQDIMLPHIENGSIKIIAMTTENPYFVVNPAIRSRCTVMELYPLSEKEVFSGIKTIFIDYPESQLNIEDKTLQYLVRKSGGDFRSALNNIELIKRLHDGAQITEEAIDNIIVKAHMYSDSGGDGHYDLLSALQKSIRGTDVDGALYWGARLLQNGDLEALMRRMQVIAFEDVGMANPNLPYNIVSGCESVRQIGLPEARILIGHMIVHMATSPKSNSAHVAFDQAIETVNSGAVYEIPKHLKDAHYKSASKLGNGVGYKYPHSYENNYVEQQYLPRDLEGTKFYNPSNNKYERSIRTFLDNLK